MGRLFQKATLATAAGGGRREQGLAPRSAIGEAACPPMTEPGTARGSQGLAFIRIRKGDAAARWAAASWETLSRGFPMRRLTPHKSCTTPKREPSTLVQACNAKRIQHLNRFIPALHLLLAKALFHGTIRRPSSIIRPLPLVCNRLPPCGGKSQARSRL